MEIPCINKVILSYLEAASLQRRKSSEEQREKKIQRAPENRLKRGHQQREANYEGSEKEEEVSHVFLGFLLS